MYRDPSQTFLAERGIFPSADTWSRLCHTGCGGYHPERCESDGGCHRNPEYFHLVTFREPHRVSELRPPRAVRTGNDSFFCRYPITVLHFRSPDLIRITSLMFPETLVVSVHRNGLCLQTLTAAVLLILRRRARRPVRLF
jgi:hypothetical protein